MTALTLQFSHETYERLRAMAGVTRTGTKRGAIFECLQGYLKNPAAFTADLPEAAAMPTISIGLVLSEAEGDLLAQARLDHNYGIAFDQSCQLILQRAVEWRIATDELSRVQEQHPDLSAHHSVISGLTLDKLRRVSREEGRPFHDTMREILRAYFAQAANAALELPPAPKTHCASVQFMLTPDLRHDMRLALAQDKSLTEGDVLRRAAEFRFHPLYALQHDQPKAAEVFAQRTANLREKSRQRFKL